MNDTNRMVSVPCELLEQALDAAAAVGMQDVADELDRILTPPTEKQQHSKPVAYAVFTDTGNIRIWSRDQHDVGLKICEEENKNATALYDHVDPREPERLYAEISSLRQHKTDYMEAAEDTRKALIAQLAERDALIAKTKTPLHAVDPIDLHDPVHALAPDSAEPSAPVERNERFNPKVAPSPTLPDLLTPEQAAQLLGLSVKTLATWRCTGKHALPFTRCGARIRYQRTELAVWLAERGVR